MQDLSAQLFSILARYAERSGVPISENTRLTALGIDSLDLPMIQLDIEDRFGLPMNWDSAADEPKTAGDLVGLARDAIAARHRPLPRSTRKKSNWMSTSARA